MSVTFRLRLRVGELDAWRSAAYEARQSTSELVRSAVAAELERRRRAREQLVEERQEAAGLDPFERIERLRERIVAG